MNQLQVLLDHLNSAKNFRNTAPANLGASQAWRDITGESSQLLLFSKMNNLTNIALKLHRNFILESEIEGESIDEDSHDWIYEVIRSLSLSGNFCANTDQLHKHTLTIIKTNIRNWNHGYTIQSKLDQKKITELLDNLSNERVKILIDEELSYDLKRILLSQIDKLMYSLESFEVMGEEFLKEAVNDFYSEAFFNKDVQNYYKTTPSFKDVIDAVSASVTIAGATAPAVSFILGMANEAISKIA